MFICSNCELRIGAEDETEVNEPSRLCASCEQSRRIERRWTTAVTAAAKNDEDEGESR